MAAAGGLDIGAVPGAHSVRISVEEYTALEPDLVLVMLCGFGIDRARKELAEKPVA